MTTKVVKGGLWTLAGQVLPVLAAFFATPFVVRLLGAEGYGVLVLVGLVPAYFSFADVGMGVASTRFASEAYARGDSRGEAATVRSAAALALGGSLAVALPLLLFAPRIVDWLNVPPGLEGAAAAALRITTITFIVGAVAGVIDSPMLARLRMDLNTVAGSLPKVAAGIATPIVLYLGGGITGAAAVGLAAGVAGLAAAAYFSSRLRPGIVGLSVDRRCLRPLLAFGGGLLLSNAAGVLAANLERFYLPWLASPESLGYYSVAFTLASMATMFSGAMVQSLVPAFSQLTGPDRKADLNALYARAIRLNLLWVPPVVMVMFVAARPFLTVWAGEEVGRDSITPFYILLAGLAFNLLAYVPQTVLIAHGRTGVFARLVWAELALFAGLSYILISRFGVAGAAAAWSLRAAVEAVAVIWAAGRYTGASFSFGGHLLRFAAGAGIVSPPMMIAAAYDSFSIWLVPACFLSLVVYAVAAWRYAVESGERTWLMAKLTQRLRTAGD